MADLVISFVRKRPTMRGGGNASDTLAAWKMTRGAGVRTTVVAIGVASVATEYSANERDDAVILRAGAACWVTVGSDPTAEAAAHASPDVVVGSHYMLANEVLELAVSVGDRVAVIAAA